MEPVKLVWTPVKSYRIKEINLLPGVEPALSCHNKVYSGDYLMNVGVAVHSTAHDVAFTSVVVEITTELNYRKYRRLRSACTV